MSTARGATAVFSDYAHDYDAPRRRLIPVFDEFYGMAVDCLRLTAGPIRASQEETDAARTRFGLDRCADTESLLEWLREAGFQNVDCLFRWWRFGVVGGWRPTS